MKLHFISYLLAFLPTLALAQQGPMDAPPKPTPITPILARDHAGFGRIGVRLVFAKDTGLPQIVSMTRGGPAADYGFQIGDVIIKIDRNFTNSLTQDEVRMALHGEPGTGLELTVQRGDDPRLVIHSVQRRVISAYSVEIPASTVTTETQS
jgi:C-terminal processing protease CtpA/Prc